MGKNLVSCFLAHGVFYKIKFSDFSMDVKGFSYNFHDYSIPVKVLIYECF